jgi:hypothetical protein
MSIIMLELIFVAAVALGLGLWQLRDVNRALREHRDEEPTSHDDDRAAHADSVEDGRNERD